MTGRVVWANNNDGLDQSKDMCKTGWICDIFRRQRQLDSTKDRKSVLGVRNDESRLTPSFGVSNEVVPLIGERMF